MEKKLDSFHLKIIAITAMLINHIGSGFRLDESLPAVFFFTEFIGKLTFPIMAYLLVEGFHYTRDVKKYAKRLAFFSIISAYPFHLLFNYKHPFEPLNPTMWINNIFFTLLMGLLLIWRYSQTKNPLGHVLMVIFFSLATIISDWSLIGVLTIFGFYRIKEQPFKSIIPPVYTTVVLFGLLLLGRIVSPESVPWYDAYTALGILCVIPILLNYNGQRGYSPNWVKWGFYLFYPLHLTILVLIRTFL